MTNANKNIKIGLDNGEHLTIPMITAYKMWLNDSTQKVTLQQIHYLKKE
jgi:hypothetical protein